MGNLRQVVLPNGDVLEYLVDGLGRRVGKKVNGVLEKQWLWRSQLQPLAELDGLGNVTKRFVYAGGVNVPDLVVTQTATYRLVKDHLGSVRSVVDIASGAIVQELDYDSWGRVLVDDNPDAQPFRFAGGLYDADTGLLRFGARDYDTDTGRWTAKDPIGFADTANRYEFVASNPIQSTDASGTDAGVLSIGGWTLPEFGALGEVCSRAVPVLGLAAANAVIWDEVLEQGQALANEWDTDTFADQVCEDSGICEMGSPYRELEKPNPCNLAGVFCAIGCAAESLTMGEFVVCYNKCMRSAGCR